MKQKIVFTSDELPAELSDRQRFHLWRDLFTERFRARLDMSRPEDRPFNAHCEIGILGGVVLAHFEGTCTRVARDAQAVTADGNDSFAFFLNSGPTRIALSQNGRDVVLGPRAAGLITHTEAATFLGDPQNARYCLSIPRPRLLDLVAHPDDLVAVPIDPESPSLRLLRRYLDIVVGSDELTNEPALADHVGRTISDLIGLVLGTKRQAAELAQMRGLRAARVEAILTEIKTGFANPEFSSGGVARKLGVTSRYVQDLLHETGMSFTERVTEMRLQRVRQTLEAVGKSGLTITEAAYAAGFNDISYFNRCFRRRFGTSPTQFRGQNLLAEVRT
jgi:AraC-like DNA-binding protein